MKVSVAQVLKFIVVGGANTLLTSLLLWVLTHVMPGQVAYTIAYSTGIIFSALATGSLIFDAALSSKLIARCIGLYTIVFLVGLAILTIAIRYGMNHELSFFIVLVTAPLNFLGARRIYSPSQRSTQAAAAANPPLPEART